MVLAMLFARNLESAQAKSLPAMCIRLLHSTTVLLSEGPEKVIYPRNDLDHDRLRQCTTTRREFIRGSAIKGEIPRTGAPSVFWPSPGSQMCNGMAFGYSLFYKNKYIRPDLLKGALEMLAKELPPLAGRVAPPSMPPGLRRMNSLAVNLNNAGIELALAETRAHFINELGPHIWTTGLNNSHLDSFGVPFYAETFDLSGITKGTEALFKVRHTRCADGHIISVTVSHLLADAGRAVRLVERLAELYRAAAGGYDPGPPLRFDPVLETPKGFADAIHNSPQKWEPSEADYNLSLAQYAAAPYRMYRHASRKFDVHMVYLPEKSTKRLKAVARGGDADVGDLSGYGEKVSTMDAVQAFIGTLVADLRRRPLVPVAPEEVTVNVDLLHAGAQKWKDPKKLEKHVGNAVHILHVPGVAHGTDVPEHISSIDGDKEAFTKLSTALRMNARLIRRAVAEFRADPLHSLQALDRQEKLVSVPEAKVGAAFVVKGADMKVASTTAVTAFPFTNIDFGHGPPSFTQINYQPRFDWWTIIQDARGYQGTTDSGGVLCTLTLEAGLQDALVRHPAWRVLVPQAHLIVAHADGRNVDERGNEKRPGGKLMSGAVDNAVDQLSRLPIHRTNYSESFQKAGSDRGVSTRSGERDLVTPADWTNGYSRQPYSPLVGSNSIDMVGKSVADSSRRVDVMTSSGGSSSSSVGGSVFMKLVKSFME